MAWVAGFVIAPAIGHAQVNLLTDLGPGSGSGINNTGHVALNSGIYFNGTVTPLGILPGDTANAVPAAINAAGEVAANAVVPQTIGVAVLYDNGALTNIGLLPGARDLDETVATGINSSGQVVGWGGVNDDTNVYGFVYSNGVLTNIGSMPGTAVALNPASQAFGVNDSGQVTGMAYTDPGGPANFDGFIYLNGVWTDLGPGVGYAINASGQVAGASAATFSSVNTPGHATLFSGGAKTDLGTLPGGTQSVGYALNATGQVVGSSDFTGSTLTHAFFYNGVMSDMNAFISATDPLKQYVTLTDARGINDSRMIVVNGIDNRTQTTHAYLLQGPWLDLAPANLSFAAQAVGTVSAAQSVSLKNSGPTSLAFSVSASGDFAETSDCPSSLVLAAGASCTIMVTFAPTAAGDLTGALTVISGGVPVAIPLSGIASIKVSISSSAASTTVGTPVTLTWTASPGAICTATGGSAADGWNGTLAVSGMQAVKEATGAGYAYGLSCTAGSQTASAQVAVTVNWPAVTVSVSASPLRRARLVRRPARLDRGRVALQLRVVVHPARVHRADHPRDPHRRTER